MTLQHLNLFWPEIVMLLGACVCLFFGLSRSTGLRKACSGMTLLTLLIATYLVRFPPVDITQEAMSDISIMPHFVKWWILVLGILLWTLAANLPDKLKQTRDNDAQSPQNFDPSRTIRGEFFAFFLFSLTGVMLCVSAADLAWLFLALELTSLPTYVMVATTSDHQHAQEAGVKYFFLGAMAAALFLYGFTLIYGATGTTNLHEIRQAISNMGAEQRPLFYLGMVLAIVGISFKIAAFPMHYYVADVYQGAATPVTAFLSFVPKAAGFIALILILSLVGWPLPAPILVTLWAMAAITMTVGNVLGILQNNVKRVLAYSSVAHSGYMLVGLAAGPTLLVALNVNTSSTGSAMGNGIAGILFYLIAYGLATTAAFAVLACLERQGDEAQSYNDLSGLYQRDPKLALVMLLAMLSLVGIPPLVGFVGKIYLFEAAINTSSYAMLILVIIAVINSAVSAVYYLRIASSCFLGQPSPSVQLRPELLRTTGAIVAAASVVVYGLFGQNLVTGAARATESLPYTGKIVVPTASQDAMPAAQANLSDGLLPSNDRLTSAQHH